jgi:prepilin signal peptidase PulO-like enzyme (type II secretory pathway)
MRVFLLYTISMLTIPILIFVLGLIIGSFLNVLGLRWNSGMGVGGRSFCVVCKKGLPWWELIPVISFLGLNGKCSKCDTKISWQYPLVELLTGIMFVTTFYALARGIPLGLFIILYLCFVSVFSIYIVIGIYDLRHKIIPDTLVYTSMIIALVARFAMGGMWLDWYAGAILFGFFALVWKLSDGRAMGFGDAKLALSIGILLGAPLGFSAFVLAFWIGTVVTLFYMFIMRLHIALFKGKKRLTMKSEIPFAPFLIIGAWLALIYHLDLFHVLAFISY